MTKITHRKRLERTLSGERPDRVPVALWRHFPVDDQSPQRFAAAVINFQRIFDFDLVKFTPASSFCLKDWGVEDSWNGSMEGTRDYVRRVIQKPEDWTKLNALDPRKGYLGEQLASLEILVKELGPETPVIQTIFNPLSQAKNLVGPTEILVHLRQYPEVFHEGLQTITESTRRFVEEVITTGAAGIFFAVQHASYNLLSVDEYQRFGRPYDLEVLEPVETLWLNMLHLHGTDIMFDKFMDYPLQIINWHDRETAPNLFDAHRNYDGVICGGLRRHETMVLGTPQDIQNEAQNAIEQTNGTRFILGTGCVTPIIAPFGNLMAARTVVENV